MERRPKSSDASVGFYLAADSGVRFEICVKNGIPAIAAQPSLVFETHLGSLPRGIECAEAVREETSAEYGGDGVDNLGESFGDCGYVHGGRGSFCGTLFNRDGCGYIGRGRAQ